VTSSARRLDGSSAPVDDAPNVRGGSVQGECVLYDVADGIATLTFNRPDRLNAWTPEMEERYFDLLDGADDDPAVRVIVVTGAGRGFCAGMDSAVLSERASATGPREQRRRPIGHPLRMRKLMIAAVNGGCAGIGLVQALCCDVRFAATTARIATSFTRRGLPPEFAAAWLLSRVVGAGHTADLMLSGRTIDGTEAEAIGFANRAVEIGDLMATVYEYARDVAANCSPRAIAYAKADMQADWSRTYADAERNAELLYHRPGHREDFAEGVSSFVEKRPPSFEPVEPRG
jgi:enoyl-CoA hydratase/carnithine racemase